MISLRIPLSLAAVALAAPALAQEPAPSNEELARRIDLLSEQVSGSADVSGIFGSGFGERVSFGGYGEVEYTNFSGETDGGAPSGKTDELDVHRVVFYFGYQFDDVWSFDSEIEYEHSDELAVEFARIDARFSEALNFTGGLLLLPMGFINETHEPNTFFAAQRPMLERTILPSTWRENGVGTYGRAGDLSWTVYLVNGFDAAGFDLAVNGVRGGRQGGGDALAEDFAVVARLDWTGIPGLLVGGSIYQGDSGQTSAVSDFGVTITELHAQYDWEALRVRGLWAEASVDDAGLLPTASASEDLEGYYLEAGWNLFHGRTDGQRLIPFVRVENIDLGAATPASTDLDILGLGINWMPNQHVVLKLDVQDESNDADTAVDTIRLTLGWAF